MEATEAIGWDRFKKLFLGQYYLRYMQNQMKVKFFELRQNKMSVAEYEKKFTELSIFVPDYIDSDEKKIK